MCADGVTQSGTRPVPRSPEPPPQRGTRHRFRAPTRPRRRARATRSRRRSTSAHVDSAAGRRPAEWRTSRQRQPLHTAFCEQRTSLTPTHWPQARSPARANSAPPPGTSKKYPHSGYHPTRSDLCLERSTNRARTFLGLPSLAAQHVPYRPQFVNCGKYLFSPSTTGTNDDGRHLLVGVRLGVARGRCVAGLSAYQAMPW